MLTNCPRMMLFGVEQGFEKDWTVKERRKEEVFMGL